MTHHLTSNKQKEAESKRKPPSERRNFSVRGAQGRRPKGDGGGGDEGVLPPAAVGCAGRRPPCPNGAPLENFGGVARWEEAAGASRWGLGPENRPSRRCAENMGPPWPGIFRSVSGPNSYGKPPIGRSQGRGGGWPPLRPPLARDPSSRTCKQSHLVKSHSLRRRSRGAAWHKHQQRGD